MRARDLGKRAAGRIAHGLSRLLAGRAHVAPGILVYHRVADRVPGLPFPTLNVRPARFREQIAGLLECGYQVWPLRRLLESRDTVPSVPDRTIVLTFDDGFEAVHLNAWPILRELGIPATVFLATGFLDSPDPFPFDPWGHAHRDTAPAGSYRPLRTEQCTEMAAGGTIELGAHTHTHRDLRGRPEAFRTDLIESTALLRTRFGVDPATFAFPFGRGHAGFSGGDMARAARDAGVLCGLTTDAAPVDLQSDPFTWGRFNVYDWDTPATLAAKLEGWYGWAPDLQKRLSPAGAGRSN